MAHRPRLVMTRPAGFAVSYVINPWMQPGRWQASVETLQERAHVGWQSLHDGLSAASAELFLVEPRADMPDLTFSANAAIVLDRRVLLSRFARDQRRGEEPVFRAFFERLKRLGVVAEVGDMAPDIAQEGAGDCLWDEHRHCFWSGFGPRSSASAAAVIRDFFACDVVPLELTDPRFYHLDTALAVLPHGELLFYPGAFSAEANAAIAARVDSSQCIEIAEADAARFCANVVGLGDTLFMTAPTDALAARLTERGYRLNTIDLSPFMLSGGAAACLTLRLDHSRDAAATPAGEPYYACSQ